MENQMITFIADSGAIEHMTNTQLLALSDFRRSKTGIIKSGNKNKVADIKIDGKGNLLIYTNTPERKEFVLTNMIVANEVSENLLSLRRFADLGFSIYLDDHELLIFDRMNGETLLQGTYEKPNWNISFEVRNDENLKETVYDIYECKARVISSEIEENSSKQLLEDLDVNQVFPTSSNEEKLEESQKMTIENLEVEEQLRTETNETKEQETTEKEQNSHKEEKVIEIQMPEKFDNERITFDMATLMKKPINADKLDMVDMLKDLCVSDPFEVKLKNFEKKHEAMLWHVQLGHASLNYLKRLQKLEVKLKEVKFGDSILECEICKLAKMEKLPFKDRRKRADRPLQIIHTDIMGPIKPISYPGHKRFIVG